MKQRKILWGILCVFLLCSIAEYVEFLFIRTDQTILAENVLCKLFAIALIGVILYLSGKNLCWLGFRRKGILGSAVLGLSLGVSSFAISYGVEYMILMAMGRQPGLRFYISNFALTSQNITGLSFATVSICIAGNILNVLAEEGLFRGLFLQMAKTVYPEKISNLIQALLFGLWHVVMVVVWVLDGSMNIPTAVVMAAGYILLAGILGYEWGMCAALTGAIWAGMFEHFFNNFITNSLHIVTQTGADELSILRIVLSNVLSLAFIMMIAKKRKKMGIYVK
ncbi:CPBP family intramembrane glutamic endopeptidase [Lactonifactor longoviformis]|uniref:CPBP family intramembrane glutamic endopeptidase n=1 Tax=Lactonifactor longoviformis TaxID=341220 RepID=UPI0036F2A50A